MLLFMTKFIYDHIKNINIRIIFFYLNYKSNLKILFKKNIKLKLKFKFFEILYYKLKNLLINNRYNLKNILDL